MASDTGTPVAYIEEELKRSYLEYSMSVIVGRALPDVRDGLKPVHRRVLYGMYDLRNFYNRPNKKSARVVGDVIGKYHPHGDAAVYDTIVRLAQDFSMRYPLVDGQGNFGSVDGDPPAAMRYTEVRMTRLAQEFLADIEKATVDFGPNYDGSLLEPLLLPTPVPNLLVNGSSGIAVGMATNIPPHNLGEVCRAISQVIENPDISIEDLLALLPGPDFPTAGFILGRNGIREAYRTGRGIIKVRARAFVEQMAHNRERIIITEIPFQVNKARLLERIADLVKEKRIEGITDIRDESDREGMRVVLDIRRDARALVILNRLYKFTQMEISFGIILLAIVRGRPQVLNLKEIIEEFIAHRRDVIIRRTLFDLKRAQERAHILEGLKKALDFLDEVIELIRSSIDPQEAKQRLMTTLELSELQAQAILDMRLQRLTGLERDKVDRELNELRENIAYYEMVLQNPSMVSDITKEELANLQEKYGDARRTEILQDDSELDLEDLIVQEDMVVTSSHEGYIKRTPASLYRAQKRGGKGMIGTRTKLEDFVERLFVASSHDYLLFFTNLGRLYWKKVYEVPEEGRLSRGKAIVNLLELQKGERIATTLAIKDFEQGKDIVMATAQGLIKKSALTFFSNPRTAGIIAIRMREEDELIAVRVTAGQQDIFLTTRYGQSIRFADEAIRSTGRVSMGNIGIRLEPGDQVVGMDVLDPGATILTVTENGFGKRTPSEDYRRQGRGGKGILTIKASERNGPVIYSCQVAAQDELMLVTNTGKIIRMKVSDISVIGRNTQGVKLIDLGENEKVVGVAKVEDEDA